MVRAVTSLFLSHYVAPKAKRLFTHSQLDAAFTCTVCTFVHFEKFIVFHRISILLLLLFSNSLFTISTFCLLLPLNYPNIFRYALFYRASVFLGFAMVVGTWWLLERHTSLYHATIFPGVKALPCAHFLFVSVCICIHFSCIKCIEVFML